MSGNYAIIAACGQQSSSGAVYVYKLNPGSEQWDPLQMITHSDNDINDSFGSSVSISGDNILIGAQGEGYDASGNNFMRGAGAGYIYKYNIIEDQWHFFQKLLRLIDNLLIISVQVYLL